MSGNLFEAAVMKVSVISPEFRARYLSDPDRSKADRAMQAMMRMRKIIIADLDKAFAG